MTRKAPGYYNAIEYIGPRPQKPKKTNFFGGWVIVVIAVCAATFFVNPLISSLLAAQNGPSQAQSELIVSSLESSSSLSDQLAAEALKYANRTIEYDASYYKISFPNGDIPRSKGMSADLVVRCFRGIGIDFQELLHEDMKLNFRLYPQLWDATAPDKNIDHRRVPNLMRFLARHALILDGDRKAESYQPGDVVVWALANAELHIGIVVPGPSSNAKTPWVIHHPSYDVVKWENSLFEHQIIGHFRYPVVAK